MIYGAKHWQNREITRYIQDNNAIEHIIKRVLLEKREWPFFRESCNGESAVMCCTALGYDLYVDLPGDADIQPGDAFLIWANDPANFKLLQKARPINPENYLNNEVPQFIPVIVWHVFGVKAQYESPLSWKQLTTFFKSGNTAELHLINPGHYIAGLAYDEDRDEVIYNDPSPGRKGLKNKGFHERLTEEEFNKDFHKHGIVFF
jgi:hypothetical protein